MTSKKADTRKTRKKSPQADSSYRTVRVLRETRENLADKIDGYHTRYIQKPIDSSRTFIEDLNKAPRKTIEKLADDSRERLADMRADTRRKVDGYLKDGRKFYRRARKDPRKTLDGVVKDSRVYFDDLSAQTRENVDEVIQIGREMVEGLEKDGRMVIDRLQATGKDAVEKLSGKKRTAKAQPLLIKKYVNGRFYDTVNKKYLKKDDLARLVKKQADIRIIYTKTGRNITRAVLSGLAVESQNGKKALLSIDEVANWLKENQKRIREALDRQVDTVRKAIKLPA